MYVQCPTLSDLSNVTRSPSHSDSHGPRKLPRSRPRGHDGRFVPKATVDHCVEEQERKVCGWCQTSDTSQWRVGPTDGSIEMGTLCNACGINYRRALTKSTNGYLNLDILARDMGNSRPSIQKALKRQRKQLNPSSPQKRYRPANKFARNRPSFSSPVSLRALPSSPISMLLCDSAPAEKQDVYGLSATNPQTYQKDYYHSQLSAPVMARFLEDPIWSRSVPAIARPNATLPPIQSLLRCIDQGNTTGNPHFRPSFLQH